MGSIAALRLEDILVQRDRLYRYLASLRTPLSRHTVRRVVDELIRHFQIHAADEEQFMERYDYTLLDETGGSTRLYLPN